MPSVHFHKVGCHLIKSHWLLSAMVTQNQYLGALKLISFIYITAVMVR